MSDAGGPTLQPVRVPQPLWALLRVPRRVLVLLVRAYQVGISPYTPPACRFYPVCSQYGVDALRVHGAVKGSLLTFARICRCNPFTRGGVDPVPAPGMWTNPRPRPRRADPPGPTP